MVQDTQNMKHKGVVGNVLLNEMSNYGVRCYNSPFLYMHNSFIDSSNVNKPNSTHVKLF